MKKIIDGKRYDTETAAGVAEASYGYVGDFRAWEEMLYHTPKGSWFTYGTGGAMTKYARSAGNNQTTGGSEFFVLTQDQALAWLENQAETDMIEKYFSVHVVDA